MYIHTYTYDTCIYNLLCFELESVAPLVSHNAVNKAKLYNKFIHTYVRTH